MSSLQTVQTKRSYLVSALAGESVEKYERLLDHLLSQNVLNGEDYEGLSLVGQPLSTLVRCLLDTITRKGETICKQFLDALHKVEDSAHEDHLCLQLSEDFSQPSQYLQRERPRIVHLIHKYINTILQQLVEHRYIQQIETDHIQLPIFSTPQKARRLLDLLRVKGDEPARFLIEFIHNVGQGLIAQVTDVCLAYQNKLKTTISAQSKFLSTYDGSENMQLEDIYTESILEIPKNSNNSEHMHGSQNQDLLSIFNAQGVLNDNADTILILGDAGSGKSTLLQQIQHLWADGLAFQNFCFIFPFSCRRLRCITKPISLKTLLYEQCCWPSDQLQDEIFQFILDNPRQVLITFDGFDELRFAFTDDSKHCSPTETTNIASLVFNLLQGNLIKDCIKVVTSRPDVVTVNLRKYVRKELHLKGFSEEGIEFFMSKHHSTPDTARDIINVVKANSSLHGLCNIPVLCWIVSKCHEQLVGCGSNTPQTMTDMYFLTLKHFFLHSSTKLKVRETILIEKVNSIRHLGKLALNGLCQGLYVFSYLDVAKEGVTEEDLSLGFLVLSRNFSDVEKVSSQYYEFLHITLQCFFAALYIIMNDDIGSSSIRHLFKWNKKTADNSSGRLHRMSRFCLKPFLHSQGKPLLCNMEIRNLQLTATFVAGLFSKAFYNNLLDSWHLIKLPRKCKIVKKCLAKGIQKHFNSIPSVLKDEKKSMHAMPEFVWLIRCIYELQDMTLSEKAVQGLDIDHLKMTYCRISPAECTALAYVLKHLKKPVGIQLDHNYVGDIGIGQLIPCLNKCHSLYLRDNNISDKGLCRLMEQILHWPSFQKIALFNNKLTDECMSSIACVLKHKQNFLSLRLGNNFITSIGGQILAEGLRENNSIKYLGLWGNQVGDTGAKAIADVLKVNRTLIWLSLVGNNIGSVGGEALAGMLERNTVLEELWLDENRLQDIDAILIAESLKKNRALKVLKLSNNGFSKTGVSALAEALKFNNVITAIWLKGTKLTTEEKEAFEHVDRLFVKR
ncbi:nucleotide-binding oligomerization domain-containing protein 2 [Hyla sarda]|uniref:nucleotide-binding oligomerization domain-containing protein 2 n=1 Tax=Hyla sarda TaxID=327740 RepID=UPI0024C3B7B7|nr:nucleotide-binding oligomerization domain-containing protein 2 [Hyla sarda]